MSVSSELAKAFARRKVEWASEILPWMYLGSGEDASNLQQLQNHGITHILNVADDVQNFHEPHFIYCNLGVSDFGGDKGISRVFEDAFGFIKTVCEGAGKVLVHCAAGQNRSVTVVIALLMMLEKLTLREAYDKVRTKRKNVCPLKDNRKQLLAFERKLQVCIKHGKHGEQEYGNSMSVDAFLERPNLRLLGAKR